MQEENPIVVIGAGPSGSFTALMVARQHVPVIVLEEHERVGFPPHCAGHVGIKGLSRTGLNIPNNLVENRIRGARFYSPSLYEFILDHGSPVTYVLDRPGFDRWLADEATRYGATYNLNTRVQSITQEGDHVTIVIGPRYPRMLVSNLVIDAEGCPATLLKAMGFSWIRPSGMINGVQAEVDTLVDVDKELVELYFSREYAPGFFAWIIPKGDGSGKIGLGVRGHDPIALLRRFISVHPVASKKLAKSKVRSQTVHPKSVGGPISRTYASNILVAGDAASQTKPTTGGGIVTGLLCSRIASEVGVQAWAQSDFTAIFLSRYQVQWKKAVWKDFLVMRRIRRYLDTLSDEKMNCLFEGALRTGILNDLACLDDIDLQGSSLLRLAKKPRALFNLARFAWEVIKD